METHKLQGAAVRLPPGEDTPPSPGVFPAGVVFALTKRSLRHDMAVDGSWDWKGGPANQKEAQLLPHTYAHLK